MIYYNQKYEYVEVEDEFVNIQSHDIELIARDLYPSYDQLEPLGQGGMGDLFKGRKTGLNVPVVVKIIKTNLKGRLDERQEAEILKGLKHKYLPRIYDVIDNRDGCIYTIMDYISGENLKDYVNRTGRVDQKTAYRWARQLCEVIAYLHEQNPAIIHSDIKPENVMITPDGDICLIDFNTSMELRADITAIGRTEGYAAPEQYSGTVTKQTDVYAIGATLYFALTGEIPSNALEEIKPLSSFRLPVSRSMIQIIERAMEKNGKDRFCDAQEMGKALLEIHRLERNYIRVRMLTMIVIAIELVLIAGGITFMTIGSIRLRQEKSNNYMELLNDAQQEKSRRNYEEALNLTLEAQELIDTRMEAYTEEAAVYYDWGLNEIGQKERNANFKKCMVTVQEILQSDLTGGTKEEWAKVYFVGAESCLELENYHLAQKWYRSAIESKPLENCYRGLICAYAFDGNTNEAKTVLEEMKAVLPETDIKAGTELIQAELCYLEKDYSGAVEHYKKLFELTNDEALLRRTYLAANNACIYGGDAYLPQAIELLEEACERIPSAEGIYRPLLANSYYTQAYLVDKDQRDVWLKKALEAFVSVETKYLGIEDRLTLNQIRIDLKQLKDAEEDLLAMKEFYSGDYRIYMRISHLYLVKYAETFQIEYRTKAEEAYREAKNYYEESGAIDSEMIAFINSWQQYVQDEN